MGASADLALPIIFMILLSGVALGDIEVFVNDSVSMRCSLNGSKDIQWHHNSVFNNVYAGGKLRPPYNRRFQLKKDETTGEYDLIIPNVTLEDAGWYYCSEELTGRRINSTQLTVLYVRPICSSNLPTDGFIGPNTCKIQQENMMFTCDVVFNGIAPHLSWRSANDSQVFNSSSCEVKSNRRSCNLTLRADPSYDGSVFRCDVGKIKLNDRRYNCKTERIKVQYFFGDYAYEKKYVHETASCEVRSNLNVIYNWTLKQDNEEIFLTSKQTASIEKSGLHQCEVEYSIRNATCSTLISVVNATEAITRKDAQKEQSTTLLAVILNIALVSIIALIGSIIYNMKQRRLRLTPTGRIGYSRVSSIESSPGMEMSATANESANLYMKSTWISKVNISDIPLELIDIILEKSVLLSIQRLRKSLQNRKDEVAIKLLASVDLCWFQRITRRRFKNVVWSMMKRYYEKKCKRYLIYKSNHQFFDEIHQINEKTNMILPPDCLSKSEVEKWKRKRSLKKRQTEKQTLRTAFLAPENKDSVFKNFLSSYDPKQQELIKKTINSEGGSARVEIKMSRPLTEFELIPQQFKDKEMKILRSLEDRDAVVWIWCYSNNALQKLNNRDGLKKLIEIVHQSVKAAYNVSEHKANIDCDQLKKKIVPFPLMMVDFITELNFNRESKGSYSKSNMRVDKVIDVTKLKRKIYVLCIIRSLTQDASLSTSICVFEDRSPYKIVEETLLRRSEISKFKSIVSSVKDNCLYLSTSSVSENHYVGEVIRVEIKENGEDSLKHHSKWLEFESGYWPSVLSISRDGDLTMVSGSSPYVLRVYDSYARLRLSVKLHKDIANVYKAVETSNGNFIIMHLLKPQTEDAVSEEMNEYNVINKLEAIEEESSSFDGDLVFTVSEVSRDGKTIIRRFIPQNQQQKLTLIYEGDFCTDSRDRVFVADTMNRRVVVLDSYLRWIGISILLVKNDDENEKLQWPLILFYDEDSHEMIIAEGKQVKIYDLIWK